MKSLILITLTLIGFQASAALQCETELNGESVVLKDIGQEKGFMYLEQIAGYKVHVREINKDYLYLNIKDENGAILLQSHMAHPDKRESRTDIKVQEGDLVTTCISK